MISPTISLNGYATVYLDQNVLDSVIKGKEDGMLSLIHSQGLVAVYSKETLIEIHRSNRPNDFLTILQEIPSLYLEVELDESFKQIDKCKFINTNPFDVYDDLVQNLDDTDDAGESLSIFLQKLYGGAKEQSFEDIFDKFGSEITKAFEYMKEHAKESGIELPKEIENLSDDMIKEIFSPMSDSFNQVAEKLGTMEGSAVSQFEKFTGVSPRNLKGGGIKPPNIIKKILDKIDEHAEKTGKTVPHDSIFKLTDESGNKLPLVQQANALTYGLNFIGYYRDRIQERRKLIASMSDTTHIGNATFCDFLMTRDEGMFKKAEAVYDFLRPYTGVIYFPLKK